MLKLSQPEAKAPNINSCQALQPHVVVGVLCKPRYKANAELSLRMSKQSGVTLFVLTHSNSQLWINHY